MKHMFKDFEDSMFKQSCAIKHAQWRMCEQVAKFPEWLKANDYLTNIPKQVLDSLNKSLDTTLKLLDAGFFTFTLNDRKARNK